jgi:hypothetical protein
LDMVDDCLNFVNSFLKFPLYLSEKKKKLFYLF